MPRFTAPADTGGITLSTGFHAVENGIVEVPDTIHGGDRAGLAANGFHPAPAAPAPDKGKKPSSEPVTDPEAE